MSGNPFSLQPGYWTTRDIKTCDLCRNQFEDLTYEITLVYGDQAKNATCVCPTCIQHLQFKPVEIVPLENYRKIVYGYEQYMAMRRQAVAPKEASS